MYVVRKPFFSRIGQFEKGKQTLVVGISSAALGGKEVFKFRIGKNPKVYSADVSEILVRSQGWTNPQGKRVLITPVSIFKENAPAPLE